MSMMKQFYLNFLFLFLNSQNIWWHKTERTVKVNLDPIITWAFIYCHQAQVPHFCPFFTSIKHGTSSLCCRTSPERIQQTGQASCATTAASTADPDKADHSLRSVQKLYLHISYCDLFDVAHPSPVMARSRTLAVMQGLHRIAQGTRLLELPCFEPFGITTQIKE